MKYILFISMLTFLGCKNKSNPYERKVDGDYLFYWSAERHTENTYKAFQYGGGKNRDSVLYYLGKMDAYQEMGKYLNHLTSNKLEK